MKFNNIYKKCFALLLLVSLTTACDDYLNEPLENQPVVDDNQSSITMEGLLIGAYAKFYDIGWEVFPIISVRGDDVNASGDQAPLIETDEFKYSRSTWMPNSVWQGLYSDIVIFNDMIADIESLNEGASNPAIGLRYIAEIKVMRAFELLQVARLWGNVFDPHVTRLTQMVTEPILSHDEVMQSISDEMDEAVENLPDLRPNERTDIVGGITKYTALAVKAWANMEMANYSGVVAATDEIIGSGKFSLDDDYYNLFKIPGKLSNESLLELQYSDFGQGTGASTSYLYAFFGPDKWDPVVDGSGNGWGFWEPTIKYVEFMLDRNEEKRLPVNVLFTQHGMDSLEEVYGELPAYVSNTTASGDVIGLTGANPKESRAIFSSGKHYLPSNQLTPGRTDYGMNNNFRVIRYSFILLMHAEAIASGASSTVMSATDAVNEVRNRADLAPIGGTVSLQQVLDEKYAELAMEWGTRFEDLVRHNMTSELNDTRRTYQEDDRFLPYPQAQVDILPQLQ